MIRNVMVRLIKPHLVNGALRRPEEGIVSCTAQEARHIVREGAGDIVKNTMPKTEKPTSSPTTKGDGRLSRKG